MKKTKDTIDKLFEGYSKEELKQMQKEMHEDAQEIEKELGKPVRREIF